jgi:hypothetical protein
MAIADRHWSRFALIYGKVAEKDASGIVKGAVAGAATWLKGGSST